MKEAVMPRFLVLFVWVLVCASWVTGCNAREEAIRNSHSDNAEHHTLSDHKIRENYGIQDCPSRKEAFLRNLIREEAANHDIRRCENVTLYGLFVGIRIEDCRQASSDPFTSTYSVRSPHLRCLHSNEEIFADLTLRIGIATSNKHADHFEGLESHRWIDLGIRGDDVVEVVAMCKRCLEAALANFVKRNVVH